MAYKMKTCAWHGNDPLMKLYHDTEWGRKVVEDRKHFEFLVLDCFQAGLSWKTILYRRKGFRKAFANFNYSKVAKFTTKDIHRLQNDEGIIRNRLKIAATIKNAQLFIDIINEYGSFNAYIWQFTKGKTLDGKRKKTSDIPATSAESDAMSKDLKKRGFSFVGSTICYAYMQAAGMVNDHLIVCEHYKACRK